MRGQEPLDTLEPDAVAEGGQKISHGIFMCDSGAAQGATADLLWRERFRDRGKEAQGINAEARIGLLHAFPKEGGDALWVAHRAGKANLDPFGAAIHPAQLQPEPPGAAMGGGKLGAKPLQQAFKPRHHISLQPDRFRQCHPHPEMWGIGFGGHRLGMLTEGLIQPHHQTLTKPSRQGGARLGDEIADAA